MFKSLARFHDLGLLILRVALGLFYLWVHGLPKLMGGAAKWKGIGAAMSNLGIDFLPVFWGFMAAATESVGALLFALGLFFRPSCLLLAFVMLVATVMHLHKGDGLSGASHAIEMGIVFFAMTFIGPGKYSVDK